MVALLAVGLLTSAAIVIDLGHARDVRQQAQSAADAAALAGMQRINSERAAGSTMSVALTAGRDAVLLFVKDNIGLPVNDPAWASCTDLDRPGTFVTIGNGCISVNSGTDPSKVRVRIPSRHVKTGLAGIIGVSDVSVSAAAEAGALTATATATTYSTSTATSTSYTTSTATATQTTTSPTTTTTTFTPSCGLCALGGGTTSSIPGNAKVTVNSPVTFNGNLQMTSTSLLQAKAGSTVKIGGTISGLSSNSVKAQVVKPAYLENAGTIADPMASYTFPSTTGMTTRTSYTGNGSGCSLQPGIYGQINLYQGSCTLTAGIYVITSGINMSGSSTLTATSGVTIYFQNNAGLSMSGQTKLNIVAPTTGATAGIAILADRTNTNGLNISMGAASTISGTIYAKSAKLNLSGTTTGVWDSFIVVNELYISEAVNLTVNNTAGKNVPLTTTTTTTATAYTTSTSTATATSRATSTATSTATATSTSTTGVNLTK